MAERMGFVRNYISLVENGRADPSHRFIKELDLLEQAPLMQHFEHEGVVREEPFGSHGSFGSSPRGRLKVRRKELGFSLEELSKRTGIVKSALRNIEEGHSRASEEQLRSLASSLDLPLEDLMGGSDHPHMKGYAYTHGAMPNIAAAPGIKPRIIPLLSWAQAGTTQAWDDVYEHEGFIGFNVKDEKAVAIQIRGDSMEPQFREGTIAIVYPTWEAKSGDLVIARLNDGTVMFKRLHVDGNNYTFISINPIYPPLTVEKSKVEKLVPVGGTFQNQL